MALCLDCGLDVDSSGHMYVKLKNPGGIKCDNDGALTLVPGCGSEIVDQAGDPVAKSGTTFKVKGPSVISNITYANLDNTGTVSEAAAPVVGTGSGTCDTTSRSGIICDSVGGGLWAPGKLGHELSAVQSNKQGATLGDFLQPITNPAAFLPGVFPNWVTLGAPGANALCHEVANDTCYNARGLITANVELPLFYIRPGEWWVFSLQERLNYKAALDNVPLPSPANIFLEQSTVSFDFRWLNPGNLDPGVPGVAVTGVLFDFSNVILPPGAVARGESVVLARRMTGAGPVNNPLVDPITGAGPAFIGNSNYLHEYRIHYISGHSVLAGDSSGTVMNGTVTSGNPCFFAS